MNTFLKNLLPCLLGLILFVPEIITAQQNIHISVFPGYHVINSDEVSGASNFSKTNWIFGGKISVRSTIRDIPLEFTAGYSHGSSTVMESTTTIGIIQDYSIRLRYKTLPAEVLWVNKLNNKVDFLIGINLTAQHRTLIYRDYDIGNDRLFSLGAGLSGKLHTNLHTFNSGKGSVFGNVSIRWTEFLYHHENGRNLDDFTLRHVAVSPEIGVSFDIN